MVKIVDQGWSQDKGRVGESLLLNQMKKVPDCAVANQMLPGSHTRGKDGSSPADWCSETHCFRCAGFIPPSWLTAVDSPLVSKQLSKPLLQALLWVLTTSWGKGFHKRINMVHLLTQKWSNFMSEAWKMGSLDPKGQRDTNWDFSYAASLVWGCCVQSENAGAAAPFAAVEASARPHGHLELACCPWDVWRARAPLVQKVTGSIPGISSQGLLWVAGTVPKLCHRAAGGEREPRYPSLWVLHMCTARTKQVREWPRNNSMLSRVWTEELSAVGRYLPYAMSSVKCHTHWGL